MLRGHAIDLAPVDLVDISIDEPNRRTRAARDWLEEAVHAIDHHQHRWRPLNGIPDVQGGLTADGAPNNTCAVTHTRAPNSLARREAGQS